MNAGGAETFLMKLYRHLDRAQFQMDFCINDKEKQFYEDEIEKLGGRMFRVPSKSSDLNEFKDGLYHVVRDNQYRYVLRVTSNAMGFLDVKIAHDAGAEVCAVRSSNSVDAAGWKSKVAHFVGRVLYGKYVNVKIAPSDLAARHTFGRLAYERGEVRMLRNAIDLNDYKYEAAGRNAIRTQLGIPHDGKVIGHVGRFQRQKNHIYLLQVFAELLHKVPNVWLLLVGDGELKPGMEDLSRSLGIQDHVVFAGVRRDVARLLSAMDVFAFPSLYEGMPNTVIEAQATGLPCVIADTITREANITGLVKYRPLGSDVSGWVSDIQHQFEIPRRDTSADFIRNGYEIRSCVREFEKIIFGEKI